LAEAEARLISSTLERFAGDRTRTAEALGISRSTLYRKLLKKDGKYP
jgi:DNA-binding NtrC family response regulator